MKDVYPFTDTFLNQDISLKHSFQMTFLMCLQLNVAFRLGRTGINNVFLAFEALVSVLRYSYLMDFLKIFVLLF